MNRPRRVLVTGASRGLGRALACRFARRGDDVVLVARGERELTAAVDAIRRDGGRAQAVVGDLGEPDVAPIAQQAIAALGGLDLLVHNASTLGPVPMPPLSDLTREDLARALAVNVLGPFALTRALLGPLREGPGRVLAVSSDAAVAAYPGWGAYSAGKVAFDHLCRIWAAELEPAGIDFVAVDPGEMNTQMHADAIPDADPSTLLDPAGVAERIATLLERRPRFGGERLVLAEVA